MNCKFASAGVIGDLADGDNVIWLIGVGVFCVEQCGLLIPVGFSKECECFSLRGLSAAGGHKSYILARAESVG